MEATFDDLRSGGVRALLSKIADGRGVTQDPRAIADKITREARGPQGQIDQFLSTGPAHADVVEYLDNWVVATRLVADAYESARDLIAANCGSVELHQPSNRTVGASLRRTFP